ncbi:MAG: ISNCY family transposase [Patescibacteria group bacterium]|nr:ISNCY family transposase [Patescibacteria group bacterium]
MTQKEARRYDVIKKLIGKKINGTDASKQLGLSVRQIKRIKARVLSLKIKGVIHGNRGGKGNRRIDETMVENAKKILNEKYHDFNPLLAQEHLRDDDGIGVSKETVRRWLIDEKLWKPRKKSEVKKHVWRERKDNYGEMEQFDGSYHSWFEGRNIEEVGEEQCLLLSVDDAKGTITGAKFENNEGVEAVFGFWKEYFEERGLPISIYLDKFSTYKVNHKNAVDNKDMMTQFERAMKQLDVRVIHASTPQAKGRVEKMNGTLQRRLVKEMRLANINTIPEANRFLIEIFIPKFDIQFGIVAKKKNDLHRDLNKKQKDELKRILSIQLERSVNNDYTIRFKNNYYQLKEVQPATVYKRDKVTIEEHLNGELKITLRNKYLDYFKLPERPKKEIEVKLIALTKTKPPGWIPPANHPWRTQFLSNKKQPARTAVNN